MMRGGGGCKKNQQQKMKKILKDTSTLRRQLKDNLIQTRAEEEATAASSSSSLCAQKGNLAGVISMPTRFINFNSLIKCNVILMPNVIFTPPCQEHEWVGAALNSMEIDRDAFIKHSLLTKITAVQSPDHRAVHHFIAALRESLVLLAKVYLVASSIKTKNSTASLFLDKSSDGGSRMALLVLKIPMNRHGCDLKNRLASIAKTLLGINKTTTVSSLAETFVRFTVGQKDEYEEYRESMRIFNKQMAEEGAGREEENHFQNVRSETSTTTTTTNTAAVHANPANIDSHFDDIEDADEIASEEAWRVQVAFRIPSCTDHSISEAEMKIALPHVNTINF